jgi:hypothetical protein
MSKIILSADDYVSGNYLAQALTNLLISKGVGCELIKTNYVNKLYLDNRKAIVAAIKDELSAEEIVENTDRIDIALIDIKWDNEFNSTDEGANRIIELLLKSHSNCCIILLSNQIGGALNELNRQILRTGEFYVIPKLVSEDKERYETFSEPKEKQSRFFLQILEKWQLSRIKTINNTPDWHKLIIALQTGNFANHITYEGATWLISDFLFPETKLDSGQVFFEPTKLIAEIEKISAYYKGPKTGIWNLTPELNTKGLSQVSESEKQKMIAKAKIDQQNKIDEAKKLFDMIHHIREKGKMQEIYINADKYWKVIQYLLKGKKIDQELCTNWKYSKPPIETEENLIKLLSWRTLVVRIYSEYIKKTSIVKIDNIECNIKDLRVLSSIYTYGGISGIYNSQAHSMFSNDFGFRVVSSKNLKQDNNKNNKEQFLKVPFDKNELFSEEEDFVKKF